MPSGLFYPLRQRQPLHVGLELLEVLLLFEAEEFEEGMEFVEWVLHGRKAREDLRNGVRRWLLTHGILPAL